MGRINLRYNSMMIQKYFPIIMCLTVFSSVSYAEDNIYAHTQAGMLSPATKNALPRVYVPNGGSNTVSVIDPATYQVIATFHTGSDPQHIVPAYDLQTLWVLNNKSNSMTPINPVTSQPLNNIPVSDPYNLYYTPDGQYAIVVSEGREKLEFSDPKTMKSEFTLPVNCRGANHMDFTIDNRYAIVSCEFSNELMKIDLQQKRVVGYLMLSPLQQKPHPANEIVVLDNGHVMQDIQMQDVHGMPQDVRSTADGKLFLVADMLKDGIILIDPISFKQVGFVHTGIGTHGIYPSRDGKLFYVSNRGCHQISCKAHGPGSVSVVDAEKRAVIATWDIPNGGSPDMGNVTANGKELWLAGRYDHEVYVFDTTTGQLTHRIPVGNGPHGLCVWPQPGRYSLGHTGNMR